MSLTAFLFSLNKLRMSPTITWLVLILWELGFFFFWRSVTLWNGQISHYPQAAFTETMRGIWMRQWGVQSSIPLYCLHQHFPSLLCRALLVHKMLCENKILCLNEVGKRSIFNIHSVPFNVLKGSHKSHSKETCLITTQHFLWLYLSTRLFFSPK